MPPVKKRAPAPQGQETQADKYAATHWGSGVEDLLLPSGQLCLVQRPGIQGLMAAGLLNETDSLTALVSAGNKARTRKAPTIKAEDIATDPKAMADILALMDRVVCYVVLKPKIELTPANPSDMEAGVIYVSSVDLDDKMFLFNYAVGGTRDLERFRKEHAAVVGSVDDGEDMGGPAK